MTGRAEPIAGERGRNGNVPTQPAAALDQSASHSVWILAPDRSAMVAAAAHLRRMSGVEELDVRWDVFSPDQGERARSEARRALAEGAVALVAIVVGDLTALPASERDAWLALAQDASLEGRLALLVPDPVAGSEVVSSRGAASLAHASSAGASPLFPEVMSRQDAGPRGSGEQARGAEEEQDPTTTWREGPKPG